MKLDIGRNHCRCRARAFALFPTFAYIMCPFSRKSPKWMCEVLMFYLLRFDETFLASFRIAILLSPSFPPVQSARRQKRNFSSSLVLTPPNTILSVFASKYNSMHVLSTHTTVTVGIAGAHKEFSSRLIVHNAQEKDGSVLKACTWNVVDIFITGEKQFSGARIRRLQLLSTELKWAEWSK